jgi:ParB family chromosome partitioning protein
VTADRSDSRGLGRGLAALLGEDKDAAAGAGERPVQTIALDRIHAGRFQPRRRFPDDELEALAGSIREKGVLQPILLRPHPDIAHGYEIVAGERRWRAAQRAGVHEIPALVRDLSDRDALEVALVENIQREDLSPLEEAAGYKRLLVEFEHTQEQLAKVVGRSRSHLANMMRLLDLPGPVKEMLDDGRLSAGHGRALLVATSPVKAARMVVARGLNVRQTERLVNDPTIERRRRRHGPADGGKTADILALEQELSIRLGLRVSIDDRGGKGEITVHYSSIEQFDDLLERLGHKGRV